MKISQWLEYSNPNIGHIKCIRIEKNKSITAVIIGSDCNDNYVQVSLKSQLVNLLDTKRNFKTLDNCKKYVEKELSKWFEENNNGENI